MNHDTIPRSTRALRDVHARLLAGVNEAWEAQRDERLQALEDRRFYAIAGAMWEGSLERQFENMPRLELNKIAQSIARIESEYRQNRISVRFRPDASALHTSRAADSAASAANSLFRADSRRSAGAEALDNAFIEGIGGGMGGARIRATLQNPTDPGDTRQRLAIEPIHDADIRLFFDPNAKLATKADARWAALLTGYTRAAYEEEFGDAPASIGLDLGGEGFDWVTGDHVFVAEFYERRPTPSTIFVFRHIDGREERLVEGEELDEEMWRRLRAVGARLEREYEARLDRVFKYIADGARILRDCGRVPGEHIPLVPFYAQRQVIEGIERFKGHVRTSKDAARLKNMLTSKLAEISSGNIQERPIFTPEQIAGHQTLWAQDNIKRNPYLLINPLVNKRTGEVLSTGPIAYSKPPAIPPALGALLELSDADMRDMLGSQEQAEKIVSNISEDTLTAVHQRLDQRTYIYTSNFQTFVSRLGEVWLSAAKEIYVEEERVVAGEDAEGEPLAIALRTPTADPSTGSVFLAGDLAAHSLDVAASFGPASSTRRAATVRQIRDVLPEVKDPETHAILTSLVIMNMDGEGMDDMRHYFRKKLLAAGAVQPTDDERREMEAAQATATEAPEAQYLRAEAEKAANLAIKARADTLLSLARTHEATASAAATASGIGREDFRAMQSAISSTTNMLPPGQPASPMQSQSI